MTDIVASVQGFISRLFILIKAPEHMIPKKVDCSHNPNVPEK